MLPFFINLTILTVLTFLFSLMIIFPNVPVHSAVVYIKYLLQILVLLVYGVIFFLFMFNKWYWISLFHIKVGDFTFFFLSIGITQILIVVFSCLIFPLFYWNNILFQELCGQFRNMSLFEKLRLSLFSLLYGIPNKVLINNKIPTLITLMMYSFISIGCFHHIEMVILYITLLTAIGESYAFAHFFQKNAWFKKWILKWLFKEDYSFFKNYFSFFWGNPKTGSWNKFKIALGGTAFSFLYRTGRHHETQRLKTSTDQELEKIISSAEVKPQTAFDVLELQRQIQRDIISRDLPILKTEDAVLAKFEAASEAAQTAISSFF